RVLSLGDAETGEVRLGFGWILLLDGVSLAAFVPSGSLAAYFRATSDQQFLNNIEGVALRLINIGQWILAVVIFATALEYASASPAGEAAKARSETWVDWLAAVLFALFPVGGGGLILGLPVSILVAF